MDQPAAPSAPLSKLLAADEPPPFEIENADGASDFFLICDHGGRRIPRALGRLGVSDAELDRHIAWDIGARGLASRLSARLDAPLIAQVYSRLVIDCNRPLASPTSIAVVSEHTEIPGNIGISRSEAGARAREIFAPYHDAITAALDRRARERRATLLVSVHSFTPVYAGFERPWHVGMLYHHDARIARAMIAMIRAEGEFVVGDNEPYAITDGSDYGIPVHGEARGLPHLELEVRQDLIADATGEAEWAERVARWLEKVCSIV